MKNLIALLFALLIDTGIAHAQFNVTNTVPANAAVGVALNQPITVEFNDMINPVTVDPTTFVVYGEQSGPYAGTLTPAGNQITFTPTIDYVPGKLITVDLTGGIMSIGAVVLTPYTFQCFATATGCTWFVYIDLGPEAWGEGTAVAYRWAT